MAMTDSSTTPDRENNTWPKTISAPSGPERTTWMLHWFTEAAATKSIRRRATRTMSICWTRRVPDHQNPETPTPCKHVQRVQFELDAGRIPRPDGRLPETALSEHSLDDTSGAHLTATLGTRIREREERIATLQAEIQALQFVCDVADAIGDGEEFELKQILSEEYSPASRL